MKLVMKLIPFVVPLVVCAAVAAAEPDGSKPGDFAYRMQVSGPAGAAAYRVALPLVLYQKISYSNLSDLRVFNSTGEQVPFSIEQPTVAAVSAAAVALPLFPLKDDSSATLDALRVTIEAGKSAINLQAGGGHISSGERPASYLVDGRSVAAPVAALQLDWPQDAADFAGKVRVEAGDNLADWRVVAPAAPIANLHSVDAKRLVEQRVELAPTHAKYWRLSWVGAPAAFVLTTVLAEPAKRSAEVRHLSLTIPATDSKHAAGEFEYTVHAHVPVDRVNLELPEDNTVVEIQLLSRNRLAEAWHPIRSAGFYRLQSEGEELRNGPISVPTNSDAYWLLRTDPGRGGLGKVAPRLTVEWVPNDLVFVARGAGPFYLAYGSTAVDTMGAAPLNFLPTNVSIAPASLSDPQLLGGEDRLKPQQQPYAWKAALLWSVLIVAAGILAWMALRLSADVRGARR